MPGSPHLWAGCCMTLVRLTRRDVSLMSVEVVKSVRVVSAGHGSWTEQLKSERGEVLFCVLVACMVSIPYAIFRGITMDIALQSLSTPHRNITILDAPGHKDFVPNMISGASQADSALLVVDAAVGEFEAGFERGGQTREHLLLVRSLGVTQVIVAVNKLDQVQWEKTRYEEICSILRPFLVQSGFHPSKTRFVPVGAMAGINLVNREGDVAAPLRQWYNGPTLVKFLGMTILFSKILMLMPA